jgi:hypothetical protein
MGDARVRLDDETGHHVPITERNWDLDLLHRKVDQDAVLRRTEDETAIGEHEVSLGLPLLQTATGVEEQCEDVDRDGLVGPRMSSITSIFAFLASGIMASFLWSLVRSAL